MVVYIEPDYVNCCLSIRPSSLSLFWERMDVLKRQV